MDRQQYNKCMSPWIKGTGIAKEERKMRFCTGAKICSGKAKTEEEAIALCKLPKPAKEPKGKKSVSPKNHEKYVQEIAQCMFMKVNEDRRLLDQLGNINSIEVGFINALMECVK